MANVRQVEMPCDAANVVGPNQYLRELVDKNRNGEPVGTYAICSAHPAVLDAGICQAVHDGTVLHVESTSSQVNQFGGYTGTTPEQFACRIHRMASAAGLPPERVLLGADHLGPYYWRSEDSATAMAKACELARLCVRAGYSKIHLDASMACADDKDGLTETAIADRAAVLCQAAEEAWQELPEGSPRPLYVIGTEVPPPGGEVAEGHGPLPSGIDDVHRSLEAFRVAFEARGLSAAWENVIALVVQPGVEFGDTQVFDYDRQKAETLSSGLPSSPKIVYEAHSTDYQTPDNLKRMVEDHFAILKVGPWLTFAYREALVALSAIERELLAGKRHVQLSQVREALETEMLANPAHWRSYYRGDDNELRLARGYSFSDRCRYYWPQASVQQQIDVLLKNLGENQPPLTLLSQYLPSAYNAIRDGKLSSEPQAIIRHQVQEVLKIYANACGIA